MKRMDEMDRTIQLRSEEWGYRAALLALSAWTLFGCWQTLMQDAKPNLLPSLILCVVTSIQRFSQIAMKQKMVAGDEEYQEPNMLLWTIVTTIAAVVIVLSLGTYFLIRMMSM